ncbi:MAG TPA: AMP-binding protein, partial [Vicinamibacterales bacterium]|nr:AMP-binding protein [Vicinamibacterales bacterium]
MTGDSLTDRPWLRFYEPGVPHTLEYPAIAVQDFLDQSAARFPDRTATVFFGARLTYRTLKELSDRFAAALVRLGIRPGDRVSMHLPNCPQFLIAYYGILKAGGIAV